MDRHIYTRVCFAASVFFASTTSCTERPTAGFIQPTPTNQGVEMDPNFEMCILPPVESGVSGDDAIDAYIAGTPIPPDILINGDHQQLENINLTPETLIKSDSNSESNYQVVIVPVGYNAIDIQKIMPKLSSDLSLIFHGVNIDFNYLNVSVPIQINNIGRLLRFDSQVDADVIFDKINMIKATDNVVFVVNSTTYGGSGGKTAIATGGSDANLYLITHELVHGIKLKDGYQRYYRKGSIPNGEIFFDKDELLDDDQTVGRAYQYLDEKPKTVSVGTCNGTPVASFYGVENIMNVYWSNEKIYNLIANGGSPFTSLQIQTMNEYIGTIR